MSLQEKTLARQLEYVAAEPAIVRLWYEPNSFMARPDSTQALTSFVIGLEVISFDFHLGISAQPIAQPTKSASPFDSNQRAIPTPYVTHSQPSVQPIDSDPIAVTSHGVVVKQVVKRRATRNQSALAQSDKPPEPIEKPIEPPIEKLVEKPVELPVELPVEKPVEQPIEQPIEKLVEKPIDKPIEPPIEKPVDKPVEQPIEKPVELPVDKPIELPVEQPIEKPVEQPIELPVEKPVELPVEKPVELPIDKPVELPVEKPVELPIEKPVELPVDKPIGKPVEQPIELPVEKPVELPVEQPVEKLVENEASNDEFESAAAVDLDQSEIVQAVKTEPQREFPMLEPIRFDFALGASTDDSLSSDSENESGTNEVSDASEPSVSEELSNSVNALEQSLDFNVEGPSEKLSEKVSEEIRDRMSIASNYVIEKIAANKFCTTCGVEAVGKVLNAKRFSASIDFF